jgi:UDP-N-acetylglucosamine 1-carboxyvinyltransferase
VSGSKNAVLPLLAATLLTDGTCEINEVPDLMDVSVMCALLKHFGAEVHWDKASRTVRVTAGTIRTSSAPCDLMKKMRASVLAMGPLLARTGRAVIPLPGGCAIGNRPIDLHLKGFHALGVQTKSVARQVGTEAHETVFAEAGRLAGAEVYLDTPSVGATENIIMAASIAEGVTLLENAAQEPEIVDLANFLNKMGAHIKGAGTDTIKIEGVEHLHGATHSVIPDRIEAGTFMLAAAMTRGDVQVTNMVPSHVKPITAKLRECGVLVEEGEDCVHVVAEGMDCAATDLNTLPYPGFPTDIQPQFMAFLTSTRGESRVHETVFENRFMHIEQLNFMSAGINQVDSRKAVIPGDHALCGAVVQATDLRAGAALILAGLAASGVTTITDVYHIDRGYDDIVGKLRALGAQIDRIQGTEAEEQKENMEGIDPVFVAGAAGL